MTYPLISFLVCRRLYSHHGFEDTGKVEYDLSEFGLEGVEIMTEMLRKPIRDAVGAASHEARGDGSLGIAWP
jgi:hypothetical protein